MKMVTSRIHNCSFNNIRVYIIYIYMCVCIIYKTVIYDIHRTMMTIEISDVEREVNHGLESYVISINII